MSSVPTPAEAPEPAPMSAFARLGGVLFNPKETFADIARRPGWLVPLLVLTLTGLGVSFALVQRADWVHVTRTQIEKNKFAQRQMEQLPAERREQAIQAGAQRSKVFRWVRGTIGSLLLVVIFGGIYLLIFKVTGGNLTFKSSCAVVAYGHLPLAIKELIAIPTLYLKDPLSIDPENILASNLAAFLSEDAPLWHIPASAFVDVFGIWCIVLMAIGFAAMDPKKISFGKALTIIIAFDVVLIGIFTGLAALAS